MVYHGGPLIWAGGCAGTSGCWSLKGGGLVDSCRVTGAIPPEARLWTEASGGLWLGVEHVPLEG
jgi:hypothetical protein